MAFIVLILKIFALPLAFVLTLGLINLPFAAIARLFQSTNRISLIYSVMVSAFYAYLYALWGAYLRAVVLNYSGLLNKWIIIALCLLSIFTSIKYISQEMQNQKAKMNEMSLGLFTASKEVLSQSILVICLSLDPFILVSFIVFFFTKGLYDTIFFKPAFLLAKLFL